MHEEFERLRAAANGIAGASRTQCLAAQQAPWQASGIRLTRGQAYTLFGDGRIAWSTQHPHLHAGPGFHLWARVAPGGRIVNVTRHSGSFIADVDGELEFGIYLGMWRDAFGALDTPPSAYARLSGALEVLALAWPDSARAGLAALATRCPHALLDTELARIDAPVHLPTGWDYLPETGMTDIWCACTHEGRAAVCLAAEDDQGIVRRPVDFPLTPTTRLGWRWRLDAHPSTRPEDEPHSHDYVSLAAEFDNGRDLTWIWSSTLPQGRHFACPIKAWSARETHWVLRNDEDPQGAWVSESRQVYADVAQAMGEPPGRIVAVWLIAVATFHHGVARAVFTDIELVDGADRLQVL